MTWRILLATLALSWLCSAPVAAEAPDEAKPAPRQAVPKDADAAQEAAVLGETLVVHAPIEGRPFALRELGVVCGGNLSPWRAWQGGRTLVPPSSEAAIGKPIDVTFADTPDACKTSRKRMRLIATGPWPDVAPESVVLTPDEGRADASGEQLDGAVLQWRSGDKSGTDVCYEPTLERGLQRCAWSISRNVPADPDSTTVGVYPRGAEPGPASLFYDDRGRRVAVEVTELKPARIVVHRVWPAKASLDISAGEGQLGVLHPEAIASAECSPLACELVDGQVLVHGGTAPVDKLDVTLRLRPRVKIWDGKRLLSEVTGSTAVLHCPMTVLSGEPYRDNDEAKVVVQVAGNCTRDVPLLDFRAERRRLPVLDTHYFQDTTLVLLELGRVTGSELTITANRNEPSRVVVAVARAKTRGVPSLRAVLEVPGFPDVDFIPTNRWAEVHVAPPAEDIYAVALPIQGVYETRYADRRSELRGDPHAAGLTGLRVGLRSSRLPGPLASQDLAVVNDPLLRSVHQANVPRRITGDGKQQPLVEVHCGGGHAGKEMQLVLGDTLNLPFGLRDTCSVVFRRDLLRQVDGTQRVRLRIEVFGVDGILGAGAGDEVVTLAPGKRARSVYVHGLRHPFDRLVVRVSHVADDTHYLGAPEVGTDAPEAKWSAVFGTERARLYATTAFPTGLYRLSSPEHSGLLSLNFGLLSRLTWLDREGKEGLLSLEAGLVVVGIGNAVTDSGESLTQVGAVVGLGLSVPFANRGTAAQAALNVHAWLEVDVTQDDGADTGRFAFIFGPSLSIGDLGANL